MIHPLETRRLLIRQFVPDDWGAVLRYASDSAVMAYIPGAPLNEEQAHEFAERNASDQPDDLAVLLKDSQVLIGQIVFHPWFAPRTYEIGWIFDRAYHGHGYATEAAAVVMRYGFEELHLHRIIATCQPENPASYRVMEKIGMQREGHFRKCIYRHDDLWWDEYFYAILADEWLAQQQ